METSKFLGKKKSIIVDKVVRFHYRVKDGCGTLGQPMINVITTCKGKKISKGKMKIFLCALYKWAVEFIIKTCILDWSLLGNKWRLDILFLFIYFFYSHRLSHLIGGGQLINNIQNHAVKSITFLSPFLSSPHFY